MRCIAVSCGAVRRRAPPIILISRAAAFAAGDFELKSHHLRSNRPLKEHFPFVAENFAQ